MIQFSCNGSLSTNRKWTIKNCTSTNCSLEIQLNENVIMTTLSELYIPPETLIYGIYEVTLTVTMVYSPSLKSSSSVHVSIIPSDIIVNFVQFGLLSIKHGNEQDLLLDPGTFSIDPDENSFDASVSVNRIKMLKLIFFLMILFV
jgi:hypothetical protein